MPQNGGKDTKDNGSGKSPPSREDRLKAQLRANLQRRKQKARALRQAEREADESPAD